jgi:serine/threonine-protein kinase
MPPDGSTPPPREGDLLAGYRLEATLGQGGMGVVFRAVREADGEVVALKILRDELASDEVSIRRFQREARMAAGLVHPHLVAVLESGSAGGRRYLVSRYVDGVALSHILDSGPLGGDSTVRLAAGVGSALDALHRRGLLHRDVKPENILVDAGGRSHLADFGVALGEADTALTSTGRVVGTVDYLAPELIRGEPASPASDLYALGCVVHACLAGAPPFAGLDFAETCLAHLTAAPPDLRAARGDLPAPLLWAADRALAKDPAERPATGAAYARLLRAGL